MRKIQDRLRHLFESWIPQLVQDQSQNNRHGKSHQQIQKVKYQRITKGSVEIRILKHLRKGCHSHPLAAVIPLRRLVVHEYHSQSRICRIAKDDH